MWQPTVCLPALQVRRKKRGRRAHPCKTRWQGSELINVCNKKKSLVKKICLTAAPGPSVVINWNTSLEYSPSSLVSFLFLLLFSLLPLAAWLFPPFSLPWCLFLFFPASFLSHIFVFPLFLSPLPQIFLQWTTVIVHFTAPCLPEFPGEERAKAAIQAEKQRQRKEQQTNINTHRQKDNDQDAQTVTDTGWSVVLHGDERLRIQVFFNAVKNIVWTTAGHKHLQYKIKRSLHTESTCTGLLWNRELYWWCFNDLWLVRYKNWFN